MKRKRNRKYIPVIAVAIIAAVAFFLMRTDSLEAAEEQPFMPEITSRYHAHADFSVMLNGKELDFSKLEYDAVDTLIHLHLRNYKGDKVLHIESRAAELGDFFASLGMLFNSTCFAADEEYCSNKTHTLKFFINGVANEEYDRYKPNDLDRILISYGNETDLSAQISAVTELACIFSQKCPVPPEAENRIIYN